MSRPFTQRLAESGGGIMWRFHPINHLREVISLMLAAVVVPVTGAVIVIVATQATAESTYTFAPYVDMSNSGESLLDTAISTAGVSTFTAAFVQGSGCTPIWGDSQGLAGSVATAEIARARSEGARVTIAFGGSAGIELAQSCTDVNALAAAYRSVVAAYQIDHVDFDIEGAAIA